MIVLDTGHAPRFAVIWLHGLGADGSDFKPIIPFLRINPDEPVRFVFPNAPQIPVTCNGGMVMPAWYDIISLAPHSREIDRAGWQASSDFVTQLIAQEVERGIPAHHIFVVGFSQGGAVAYLTGLTHAKPLAGIMALSTYLPEPDYVRQRSTPAGKKTPLFIAHGTQDEVVSLRLGEIARDTVAELGCAYDWQTYDMGHEVCLHELQAIGDWINARTASIS